MSVVALPNETRVGGNLSYAVTVANVGRRTAYGVKIRIAGGAATLLSVSARRSSCSPTSNSTEEHVDLHCWTAALAPRASAKIDLALRAITLGPIRIHAQASTSTHGAATRDNRASAVTPVRDSDRVRVNARVHLELFPIELVLDAVSGPRGRHPEGAFLLEWQGRSTGRVSCLSVSGNKAVVGVSIEQPDAPPAPGATRTRGLVFVLRDNGSPGAGRDTLTFVGAPLPSYTCAVPPVRGEDFAITSGEITIVDAPHTGANAEEP